MPNKAVERGPSAQGRSTWQLPDSLRWVLLLLPPVRSRVSKSSIHSRR
jgi:hypothetical protein